MLNVVMVCFSLSFAAVWVMLMLGSTTSLRQFLNPDELPAVKSMCDAQCEMLCLEIGDKCHDVCGDYYKTYKWKLNCSYGGDCMNQGYCANLEKYSRGYVPQKPIINVERDLLTQTLTVRWTKISSRHRIIYVIQSDQTMLTTRLLNGPPMQIKSELKTRWVTLGWADSSFFIFPNFADVCLRPKFRVAAVSQFGSQWFTKAVQTPELLPGRATNISASNFKYVDKNPGEVYFHLTWDDPPGWKPSDVLLYQWKKGPSTCQQAQVFFQNPKGLQSRQMIVRIPENGIGCTFNLQIEVVSRCGLNIRGPLTTFKFELDCKLIANYTCKPPVYNPPGNVEKINIRVIPTNNGPLIQLNWQPPTDLGSVGIIDQYHIQWGLLDQNSFDDLLQIGSLYNTHTFSVPGTKLWTQIQLGKVNSTDIYGVQIMPSAPGHDITYWLAPIKSMPVLPADWPRPANDSSSHIPSPHIIKDENGVIIVLVPIHPHPSVRLFLNMPEQEFDDNVEGFAVQWGHMKQNKGSPEISIDVLNSSYIPKNVSTIDIENLHPKKDYGIKVLAVYKENDTSESPWDEAIVHRFTMPEQADSAEPVSVPNKRHGSSGNNTKIKIISLIISLSAAVIIIIPVIFYVVRKRRKKLSYLEDRGPVADAYRHYTEHGSTGYRLDTSTLLTPSVVPDKWELPHSSLRFGQVLGTGAFGLVLKGQITSTMLQHRGVAFSTSDDRAGLYVTVAIKLLQEGCDGCYRLDFLKEIALMKNIGYHVNVVSMLGCCTLCDPVCLVVEHMSRGDLLDYLKNIRHCLQQESGFACDEEAEDQKLTSLDLLSFARQIAKGMEFLSQKGFVHRDLAARNVLVGADRTLKIGDFGLTRYIYDDKVYINCRGGKLPLKWMSIEAIFERTYSTASDIWSYGIVLFEIVTLGGTPYPTVPNKDLLMELRQGYRMQKPDNCSDEIYQLMLSCWKENPRCRPDFTELCLQVESMMETCTANDYLDLTLNLTRDYYTIECESDGNSNILSDSEFDGESHSDRNIITFSCSEFDEESDTEDEDELQVVKEDFIMPSTSQNTDVKVYSTEDTSINFKTSETQNNIPNICCESEEMHLDSVSTSMYAQDKDTEDTEDINSSSAVTVDVLVRNSKTVSSITPKERDYKRPVVHRHDCSIADEHLTLNDGTKGKICDHVDLTKDVKLEMVSESSDSNIEPDWDDVFTEDDNDVDDDDNDREFLHTLRPLRNATIGHFQISSEDKSDVQTDSVSSVISTQYLIPSGDQFFTRTESLVSTTSLDSGFPQSPIHREQTFNVVGTPVSGKYKKATNSRLCSSGGVWQKMKKKHKIFDVSECFSAMLDDCKTVK